MQVNAIKSHNDTNFTSMQPRERKALESLANANDKQLRMLANQKAAVEVNEKKHNRISNLMLWSIPLAAGLSLMAATHGKIKGADARLKTLINGSAETLSWAATFGTIGAVFDVKNRISKHSAKMKNFDNEHPFVSFVATAAASFGALALGRKGLAKLGNKMATKSAGEAAEKAAEKIYNSVATKLNNSKVLNTVADALKKVPSSIRAFAKDTIAWGPTLLLAGSLYHSVKYSSAKSAQAVNNYGDLKLAQAEARQILQQEDIQADIDAAAALADGDEE
jgi:hypothetical protein